ncbi:MAG: proline--tRNA ligase [bacterium]|uniref:Proline--tRNA ligase n=1 Tax=Candidatus Methylomirabilis tolerans TaxID=3123416 RepID=A0AAJ1EJY0_9BACT|nr:proline--tRNA ligase [Candidatus Methylomirabilis sp.]
MRWTRSLIPTLKEAPADAEAISHTLMVRAGLVRQLAAGIYVYLPLGQRVMDKVNGIIREEMDRIGGQEITMPILHPAELWQQTGRWTTIGEEMFRLHDRGKRQMCLGMTHEEVIAWLAAREIRSYRDLPQIWYQIQTKLRDEARPKSGVLRTREFLMKDSYSLDRDEDGLARNYEIHKEAYRRIMTRCGLAFHVVESDPGMMGGATAHEFMAPSQAGEDEVALCERCSYSANVELAISKRCPHCEEDLRIERVIEVGNIFKLGIKYSIPLKAMYLNEAGEERPVVMGSYGIGPARIAAAAIEQRHDELGIVWPTAIAPFQLHLLPVNVRDQKLAELAEAMYAQLVREGIEVLHDDRDERPGVKFKDADLLGLPLRMTVGTRTLKEGMVDLKVRKTGEEEQVPLSEAVSRAHALLSHLSD